MRSTRGTLTRSSSFTYLLWPSRDVTYALYNEIEFTNGVTETTVQETHTDSASSVFDGTSATEHVQYAQARWIGRTLSGSDDGTTATRVTTSDVNTVASGRRDRITPPGAAGPTPGQVVSAWVSLEGSSSSRITNTGVRDPNVPGSEAIPPGAYSTMLMVTPGWTWTHTGNESSTLNESVGETRQSMPDLQTGAAVQVTSETTLEMSTSASELQYATTVLRTTSGSSTMGDSWSSTSTAGTSSSTESGGISEVAHALVPVGSDGLSSKCKSGCA